MRAALYARVSREEQTEGYSLDAQLRACRKYAKENEILVIEEYVDEGHSAHTDKISKRPEFKRMMYDAKEHHFDVIVVHKLDRFSRNLMVTLQSFKELGNLDVSFISISENMDFSTPWGKLALILFGALAEFYSDNLGLEVKRGNRNERLRDSTMAYFPLELRRAKTVYRFQTQRPTQDLNWPFSWPEMASPIEILQ